MSEKNSGLTTYYAPVMVLLLIVGSFFLGRLTAQLDSVKKGAAAPTAAAPSGDQAEPTRKLDVPSLKGYAKALGMDSNKFDKCLDDGTYAKRVGDEQKEGSGLGVSGTPSFFVNGVLLVGAQPQSAFEEVIDAELKDGSGDKVSKAAGGDGLRKKLVNGQGPVMGAKDAKIKVIEFTDFECPFCERAFPTISALMEKYKGKISLEYRSFPLSFHPFAQKSAEAALCANDQGKFWEMHDRMFAAAQ